MSGPSQAEDRDEVPRPRSSEPRRAQSLFDLIDHPLTRVAPHYGTDEGAVSDPRAQSETVIRALCHAVDKTPFSRLVEAASAAFHAEPLLGDLCKEFERPVRSIAISEDSFVLIVVNLPEGQNAAAQIAMGPHGEGACWIKGEGFEERGFLRAGHVIPLGSGRTETLTKLGLPRRPERTATSAS